MYYICVYIYCFNLEEGPPFGEVVEYQTAAVDGILAGVSEFGQGALHLF